MQLVHFMELIFIDNKKIFGDIIDNTLLSSSKENQLLMQEQINGIISKKQRHLKTKLKKPVYP